MARAPTPKIDTAPLLAHLRAIPQFDRLRSLDEGFAEASEDTVGAILDEAATFAAGQLDPLSAAGEAEPPQLRNGAVVTCAMHKDVWRAYSDAGWLTLDLPEEFGGQGLPLVVAVAVQEIFDRHSAAFGMTAVSGRSAARLIKAWAQPALAEEWVPRLLSGEWAATICISESGAGSDAMRITTTGRKGDDGIWRITGEKQWISYGGHDLTERIGHCLLARTEGRNGLSLFLVPDRHDDRSANGVFVRSIEHKLGLHLSPTCAMGFEDAQAILLGEEGRGLAQMFTMITNMRISTGAMGLGIASGPVDVATAYARERRQGGRGPQPVPIVEHADVQRQLLDLHARLELARGLIYHACVIADLAQTEEDPVARERLGLQAQFLLPVVKTLGGDTAFASADGAIQVLGGAGYTADWPVEQALRDARVLSVFEGTTGIQALDLLHRRIWKEEGRGLLSLLDEGEAMASKLPASPELEEAIAVFATTRASVAHLIGLADEPREAEAGATAFLYLATQAALAFTAVRLLSGAEQDPQTERLKAIATYWLEGSASRAQALRMEAQAGSHRLDAMRYIVED